MPKVAKKITMDRAGEMVYIDGVEFPWYIAEEGPWFQDVGNKFAIPVVYIPILAEGVEIIPKDN